MCVHAHTCKHVGVLLFQYGPYSDVSEMTTAAGPPGQCRAPCVSFTPDGCVLVSWEVSQTRALHYFPFLWLYLPRMHVRRKLFKAQTHYRWLLHISLPWHLLISFRVVEILPLVRIEGDWISLSCLSSVCIWNILGYVTLSVWLIEHNIDFFSQWN